MTNRKGQWLIIRSRWCTSLEEKILCLHIKIKSKNILKIWSLFSQNMQQFWFAFFEDRGSSSSPVCLFIVTQLLKKAWWNRIPSQRHPDAISSKDYSQFLCLKILPFTRYSISLPRIGMRLPRTQFSNCLVQLGRQVTFSIQLRLLTLQRQMTKLK